MGQHRIALLFKLLIGKFGQVRHKLLRLSAYHKSCPCDNTQSATNGATALLAPPPRVKRPSRRRNASRTTPTSVTPRQFPTPPRHVGPYGAFASGGGCWPGQTAGAPWRESKAPLRPYWRAGGTGRDHPGQNLSAPFPTAIAPRIAPAVAFAETRKRQCLQGLLQYCSLEGGPIRADYGVRTIAP